MLFEDLAMTKPGTLIKGLYVKPITDRGMRYDSRKAWFSVDGWQTTWDVTKSFGVQMKTFSDVAVQEQLGLKNLVLYNPEKTDTICVKNWWWITNEMEASTTCVKEPAVVGTLLGEFIVGASTTSTVLKKYPTWLDAISDAPCCVLARILRPDTMVWVSMTTEHMWCQPLEIE